MKLHRAPTDRNAEPIREVLERLLPDAARVLEVASGSGQHAAYMAKAFPSIDWQPTDMAGDALASIPLYVEEAGLSNVREPFRLDVTDESTWPAGPYEMVFNVNMVHIAPFAAAEGLFRLAARVLTPGGMLVTYGPYRFGDDFGSQGNIDFDASLRGRNPSWGIREVGELDAAAQSCGLARGDTIAMPANNHVLVFRRVDAS